MTNTYATPVIDNLLHGTELDALAVFCWDRGHDYDDYMSLVGTNDYQDSLSREAFDKVLEELETECVEYHKHNGGGE